MIELKNAVIPANRSPIVPEADGKPSFRRAYIVVFELTLMTEYAGPKALKITLRKKQIRFLSYAADRRPSRGEPAEPGSAHFSVPVSCISQTASAPTPSPSGRLRKLLNETVTQKIPAPTRITPATGRYE